MKTQEQMEQILELANKYYDQEEYAKAFPLYVEAAEAGDETAMYLLGRLYEDGDGTEQDYEKAFEWHTKATANIYDAQVRLGYMYLNGTGVEQDYTKSFECFLIAAEAGIAEAQFAVGCLYDDGEGTEQDYGKAFEWYEKAAENDHPDAQNSLAIAYFRGEGREQDTKKAYEWYEKAAEGGNINAQHFMGYLYYCGDEIVKPDYEKAFRFTEGAAEAGNVISQYLLGTMYYNGDGTEQNLKKAFAWYKEAAEAGDVDAQSYLGDMYFNGEGTRQDDKKAGEWYKKAAEQGNDNARRGLLKLEIRAAAKSTMYYQGEKPDFTKAFEAGIQEPRFCGVENLLSKANDLKLGDVIEFGIYPQTTAGDIMPIEWYVIKIDGDNILLLSKYILDYMPFNSDTAYITWADCSLRNDLNEDFYRLAFSEKEKTMIVLNQCKDNGQEVTRSEYGGRVSNVCDAAEDTEDYVFLLSDREVWEMKKNLDRRTYVAGIGTEYAKKQGLSVFADNGFSGWWLRTRSSDKYRATFQTMAVKCWEGYQRYPYDDDEYFEDHVGEVSDYGEKSDSKRGVRPAIMIRLR